MVIFEPLDIYSNRVIFEPLVSQSKVKRYFSIVFSCNIEYYAGPEKSLSNSMFCKLKLQDSQFFVWNLRGGGGGGMVSINHFV